MPFIRSAAVCFLVLAASVTPTAYAQESAQEEVRSGKGVIVTLSGALQTRATWGLEAPAAGDSQDRIGFGVRRARFRVDAAFSDRAGLFIQTDGSGGGVSVLDFVARYRANEQWLVRMGRMSSASPRGQMTSFADVDFVDRTAIVERWAAMTIGAQSRDFGIEAEFDNGATEAVLFVHQGDGDWSHARGNYRPVISGRDVLDGRTGTGIAVTGAIAHDLDVLGGVEVGGFAGVNRSRNPLTEQAGVGRSLTTGGLHAYWGSQPGSRPTRVKLDALAIGYERLSGTTDAQQAIGFSVMAARRVTAGMEVVARVEQFDTDRHVTGGRERYHALAVVFSPSARRGEAFRRERITLGWQRAEFGVDDRADMVLVQLQLVF